MIITFAEHNEGAIKKSTLECLTYGRRMADLAGSQMAVVVFGGGVDAGELGKYGADQVVQLDLDQDIASDTKATAQAIAQVSKNKGGHVVVLSHNSFGKGVAGRLAIRLNAGLVSGVTKSAEGGPGNWTFEKNVFSGKASAKYQVNSDVAVLTLMPNSTQLQQTDKAGAVENMTVSVESSVKVTKRDQSTGTVSLPEAELVVSAGRGMKGPENWGIIDELADVLGATTACSRPVADADWRPHHEHVGQTGIAIRPNLYIAIGISGAIQHLAGVNNSKVIVVINKDSEAPFFKAADYGVCADLFDVVPRLTEAIRKYKS